MKNNQKFNEAAVKVLKEFEGADITTDMLLVKTLKLIKIRTEAEEAIMELITEAKGELNKGLATLKEEIAGLHVKHKKFIASLREAQPELKDHEFRFSRKDETFRITGPREPDDNEPVEIDIDINQLMPNDIEAKVAKLFNQAMKSEEREEKKEEENIAISPELQEMFKKFQAPPNPS